MPLYRFRIPGGFVGIVSAPTQPMAKTKVSSGANERNWFNETEIRPEEVEIDGILFDHITMFCLEDETVVTLGF